MHLFVQRENTDRATMGKMLIDGEYFCHTLEPRYVNPGVKVNGQTAIPAGCYLIQLDKFYLHDGTFRVLPHIMNIPNFTRVFIHRLNRVFETQGCIGIGFKRGEDPDGTPVIWESKKAEEELMRRMLEAESREVLGITVKDFV